tara:strand:+ start:821 stop:982 length:162 start_codon:yes stop_codon:yes gene_type:complete
VKKEVLNPGIQEGVCDILLMYIKINKIDEIEVDKNNKELFFVKLFLIIHSKKI